MKLKSHMLDGRLWTALLILALGLIPCIMESESTAQNITPEAASDLPNTIMLLNSIQPKSELNVIEPMWKPSHPQRFPSKRQGLEEIRMELTMVSATFRVDFGGVDIGTTSLKVGDMFTLKPKLMYIPEKNEYLLNLSIDEEAKRVLMGMLFAEGEL